MVTGCPSQFATLMTLFLFLFFFNDTTTTEIYTLSLHDALPILECKVSVENVHSFVLGGHGDDMVPRSEEHTSELQSRGHLVCRLLLEKKKTTGRVEPNLGRRVGKR